MTELCHPPTNRVRCALNKEILDLLNDESISGESSGRASHKFNESYYECLKMSRSLKYDSIFLST